MRKLLCLILCVPLLATAQIKKGINFQEALTWDQVKAKAKSENKYIFLDCFATWCGPCKKMDKEVYTNDTVASFFNDKFISVKVQMDQTKNDGPTIRSWYSDAVFIGQSYRVLAYPSYIFLNPEGVIVHKETGVKAPSEFISIAELAISPGKVYNDPYARYDSLVMDYKQGKKNYAAMLYMIKASEELYDTAINKQLRHDYNDYLLNLRDQQLYTKENIEYISSFISSKSRFFHLFHPDGRKIDEAINEKGYAQKIVDQVILYETVIPFLQIEPGVMQLGGKVEKKPEPDWKELFEKIKSRYSKDYAERNLLEARILWNEQQKNYSEWIKYSILKFQDYGIDTSDIRMPLKINKVAWEIFERSSDKKEIRTALQWMEIAMKRIYNFHPSLKAGITDTYACLLYKSGKREEAIQWEEKALKILTTDAPNEPLIADFKDKLEQMQKGKPTWIVE